MQADNQAVEGTEAELDPPKKPRGRPKKVEQPKTILAIATRRFGGIPNHRSRRGYDGMAEVGEEVELPVERARELQDAGIIKIKI